MAAIKEKAQKSDLVKKFFTIQVLRSYVNYFKYNKHDFELSVTGYTAMIKNITEKRNYFFIKNTAKSPYRFTQKIKSEIKNSGIWIDEISVKHIKFFKINNIKPIVIPTVYNVDINGAYPNSLKNLGLVSEGLFEQLMKLDKMTRLKAIGMLATNKSVFIFKEGKQIAVTKKRDELMRNCWLALCQYTGEAIDECRINCNSFLFYWFDGIYFTDKNEAQKMIDILKAYKFESKLEVLKNFTVKELDYNIQITYGKGEDKKKFLLPKGENISYFS